MKKETLDKIEQCICNFMGGWFYEDIDEENRLTRLILFPLLIVTFTIGVLLLLPIYLFRSSVYPEDYRNY
jgi:hypothetical protein